MVLLGPFLGINTPTLVVFICYFLVGEVFSGPVIDLSFAWPVPFMNSRFLNPIAARIDVEFMICVFF